MKARASSFSILRTNKRHRSHSTPGFTIVELLIVIVVIAILAAITTAAYNGVQNRANDSVVQADLKNTYNKLLQYQVGTGLFPLVSDTTVLRTVLIASKTSYDATVNGYIYCRSNTDAAVVARSGSKNGFYYGTKGKGTIMPGSWNGSNVTLCPLAGIATTDPGYAYFWFYLSPGGWTW